MTINRGRNGREQRAQERPTGREHLDTASEACRARPLDSYVVHRAC